MSFSQLQQITTNKYVTMVGDIAAAPCTILLNALQDGTINQGLTIVISALTIVYLALRIRNELKTKKKDEKDS